MTPQVFHTVVTPGVPSLVLPASSAVALAPTDIAFSWKTVTGADKYNIQISTSSAFDNMTDPSSIDKTTPDASTTATADWSYGTGYWRVAPRPAVTMASGRPGANSPPSHIFMVSCMT